MATLTIRNVPDALYAELKARAARNRRSLNQEVIAELEHSSTTSEEDLAREIAAFRKRVGPLEFTLEELDGWIDAGRDRPREAEAEDIRREMKRFTLTDRERLEVEAALAVDDLVWARVLLFRTTLPKLKLTPEEIDAFVDEGRR